MNELGDLLGSIEEHEANYRRLIHDMESFRSQHNLEKGFSDKLAHATDLVRNLVPIRCVNLSMAIKIAENDGVYSLRSAVEEGLAPEKKHGDGRGMSVADIKYGLDRFIYSGFGRAIAYGRDDYGEIPILFQHETMDKEDTVCVPSDFLLLSGGNFDHYKNHVIRGRRFRDFMANVIATFFKEPSDYLTVDFDTQPEALKWVDFCFGPEVLLYDRVGLNDVQALGVTKRQKTALEKVGMPPDKLVVLSKSPSFYEENRGILNNELYEISKAKAPSTN